MNQPVERPGQLGDLYGHRRNRNAIALKVRLGVLAIEEQMTEIEKTTGRRVLIGRVVSDKMEKTVTVEVTRRVKHAQFRKYINRSKRYKAHDENNEFKVDDLVEIKESRPLSRTKRWTVVGRRSE